MSRELIDRENIYICNNCRKWEIVKKELDKCDLLCANCHMETHDEIDGIITSNRKP